MSPYAQDLTLFSHFIHQVPEVSLKLSRTLPRGALYNVRKLAVPKGLTNVLGVDDFPCTSYIASTVVIDVIC